MTAFAFTMNTASVRKVTTQSDIPRARYWRHKTTSCPLVHGHKAAIRHPASPSPAILPPSSASDEDKDGWRWGFSPDDGWQAIGAGGREAGRPECLTGAQPPRNWLGGHLLAICQITNWAPSTSCPPNRYWWRRDGDWKQFFKPSDWIIVGGTIEFLSLILGMNNYLKQASC